MRISFDLDDTLICYGTGTPCEPRPPWYWNALTTGDPLRYGARSLMQTLRTHGHELWIYTTSFRAPGSVKFWLWTYGIRVMRVVNQNIHERHIPRGAWDCPPSKNPRMFDIDLHVDDSDGVKMEGDAHGFRVVVVTPDDEGWTDKVLAAVDDIRTGQKFRST